MKQHILAITSISRVVASQRSSVAADLVDKGILKESGQVINLSHEQFAFLEKIANALRANQSESYFIALPESAGIILRLVIVDILYLAVGRPSSHIYFVTDNTGKAFLERMLHNLHTYSSHLSTVLLWYQSRKISIIVGQPPRSLQEHDLLVLFRNSGQADYSLASGQKIILFTLRDLYQLRSSFAENLASLRNSGWTELSCNTLEYAQIRGVQLAVDLLTKYAIGGLLQELVQRQVDNPSLQEHVNAFTCFYSTVPVPLKYYAGFGTGIGEGESKAGLMSALPSVYLQNLPVRLSHYLALKSVCFEIEKHLQSSNPKYVRLLEVAKANKGTGRHVAIVAPNKAMADALEWGIHRDLGEETVGLPYLRIFYPEKFFAESLFCSYFFNEVIFPFSPPTALMLAACALTSKLRFIQYPHEATILEGQLASAQEYDRAAGFPSFADLTAVGVHHHTEQSYTKGDPNASLGEVEMSQTNYGRFLKLLEEADPKDQYHTYDGFVDTQHYILHTQEGAVYTVHGWENIILYREGELFYHTKYTWVFPRDLTSGDSVILPPLSLKEDFLRNQIAELLADRGQQVDALIGRVAEWKNALAQISRTHPFVQIYERLRKQGITKDYKTVQNWFAGLINDPKQAALFSIMNAGLNIGPRDELDIKLVGEAFGIKQLVVGYEEIHAAMRIFRVNNSSCGRLARANLVRGIENPSTSDKCSRFTLSEIIVSAGKNPIHGGIA